ncbi:hypothetical protein AVEN_185007-1 [Araneus ventricosus]|uniref:Uncharacterized protein n=1 Tax=Araneus ventricosus TaxID=182803 RepID=A0A4Y2BP98_ARAVE|nr:hypothetical protein AVEN_185007-1 [Araneus ventricosus]
MVMSRLWGRRVPGSKPDSIEDQLYITLFARRKKLKLADPYEKAGDLPIEVLIGDDFYCIAMTVKPPKKLTVSLVLIPSVFGWILSGSRTMTNIKFHKTSAIQSICTQKVTLQKEDEDVRNFWDLETLGIEAGQEKRCLGLKERF